MPEAITIETNQGRKVHLLRGLIDARSTLTLTGPDLKQAASTTLVDVLPESDAFVLDELVPRTANILAADNQIYLQGKLKGVLVEYYSKVRYVHREGDLLSYVCSMPEEVVYHQKRREFRLRAPAIQQICVNIASDDDSLKGRLIDISVGGTNIELNELPEWIEEDKMILCELELDDDLRLETDAIIRHVGEHNIRRNQVHRLGLQLLSLTPAERRKLQQWINVVERKRLRFD